jgi:hypothetical protein
MQSNKKSYFVTVRKSANICYEVCADSFEDALSCWDHDGEEVDVDPNDLVILSIMVSE